MDFIKIQKGLSDHNTEQVYIYLGYLKKLATAKDRQGKLKNPWMSYLKDEQAISLYKKVALDGLYIDGDTITLTFKGAAMVSYNYQAYKNKLLMVYPNSKFDIQNVYEGDAFKFTKESGNVHYSHDIKNPFATDRKLIGAYCIIKNERGEFIETLNLTEIDKMKNVAKTKNIWNTWFEEMVLKSVIKRACKRHFKDVVVNIEELDNENYELENAELDADVQDEIADCETTAELNEIYGKYIGTVTNEPAFIELLANRKAEIKSVK